jgi:hypothetical protein
MWATDVTVALIPATPATTIVRLAAPAAATSTTRLAADRIPSLAPRTAARSQFER